MNKKQEKQFDKDFGNELKKRDGICKSQPCDCCNNIALNLKQFISSLLKTQEQELNDKCHSRVIAEKDKSYDLGISHYKQECQKLSDEQHERANDNYASCLTDIHSKLKKIQILADQEQALKTDIALQELIKEIISEI